MQALSRYHLTVGSFRSSLLIFFKKLANRINNLFRPEEVEVTFKVEGKNITYTYTVVEQKQVA
jgi:hypothetical protein